MLHTAILKESQKFISPGIIFAFSRRRDGNMSLRYGRTEDSLESRKNFLSRLGIDYRNLVCARQVHSSHIQYVTEQDIGKGALSDATAIDATDALVTDRKNLPLAVFTADCLSLFLYDPETSAIGLVHAGWRSSQENISSHVIKFMQARFHTRPEALSVVFGPSIKQCCYMVAENFKDIFPKEVSQRSGRFYLDLVAVNKRQVLEAGAKEENLLDCAACTSCQKHKFFSFRREGKDCGRMISVAMLKS